MGPTPWSHLPYEVTLPINSVHNLLKISIWCNNNFGDQPIKWMYIGQGRWLFPSEEQAAEFALIWT
jgi:hypothetical protein